MSIDWLGTNLTPSDRITLALAASRYALVMAAIAGGGWYLTALITQSNDPIWHGAAVIAVVFLGAFGWKWRGLLVQLDDMRSGRK
jgi:hypothetical protein